MKANFSKTPLAALLFCFLISGLSQTLLAEVKLARIFTDSMVVQREKEVSIWGTATVGEKVTVRFRGKEASAVTGANGKWTLRIASGAAGGPFVLTAEGSGDPGKRIELKDVLVGEVWLAGGQSNMAFLLMNSLEGNLEVERSANDQIRYYLVTYNPVEGKAVDQTPWELCGPATSGKFSAVAHFFAKALQAKLGVPVGVIGCYKGGTPAEAWMNESVLKGDAELKSIWEKYESALLNYSKESYDAYVKELRAYKDAAARGEGGVRPKEPMGPQNGYRPSGLYKTMLSQTMSYTVRGFLWYQGEANVSRHEQYGKLFSALIKNWRSDFGGEPLPFLFVQLPSYNHPNYKNAEWAWLRDSQFSVAKQVTNTAMVVSRDTGEEKNLHPIDKKPIGERLALAARGMVYGEKISWSGPLYADSQLSGREIVIRFQHTADGLIVKGGGMPKGFQICGPDQVWKEAVAEIRGDKIVVTSTEIEKPMAVRYAWANWSEGNVYNMDGLPASPFRTDTFTFVVTGKSKVNENE